MAGDEDEALLQDEAEGEELEAVEEQQPGTQQPGDEGDGEPEILFGEEAAPASGERETGLVKHLREQIRKRDAIIAERPAAQKVEMGPKPTIAGCEFDEERYEAELDAWKARQSAAKEQETAQEQQSRQAREEFERDEQSYREKRARLTFADVDEAEAVALGTLSKVQYASVLMAADDPAKVLYALGKRPDKLAELSQIQNPLKLAAAVARLEGGLKVMPRRQVSEPEEVARGSGAIAGGNKALERLEKEAEKSGDRSKVVAFKAQLKAQAKK